ncbi:NAD-dependent epimerase/dehydratase family protein [Halorubrum laminariae]|uniref:NAD-dependent epimerase/dehydratase family protein n=1 Tax=Halorubrum laminariae TaxID=1433523 RepID=A0ABD6C2C3_9EURY|nr:NAD-dependent epimerase/dehydratase family protein [Halorubrum laminariae]
MHESTAPDYSNIVVTGGTGFIGSHLTEALLARNNDVTILDDLSAGDPANVPADAELVEGDVRDQAILDELLADAEYVFHEAALASVADSIDDPEESHSRNSTGTLRVLEAASRHDVDRVVLASSAAIYGHPEYTPIDEDHPTEPTSPYGLDKLASDHYARLYNERYGLDAIPLRYFNVYGPRQSAAYAAVIAVFRDQARSGEPITIEGDGTQTRDFVHVDDVVQANLRAATCDARHCGNAYNVATGETVTIQTLAETVRDVADSDSEIVHVEPREGDIDHSVADITAAREHLGYEPTASLEEGLTDLLSDSL